MSNQCIEKHIIQKNSAPAEDNVWSGPSVGVRADIIFISYDHPSRYSSNVRETFRLRMRNTLRDKSSPMLVSPCQERVICRRLRVLSI